MLTTILFPESYDAPKEALALAVHLAQAQATQAYPDEQKRIADGGALVLDGAVTLHDTYATVQSRSGDVVYTVNGTCQCKAVAFRGADYRCAHRWARSVLKRAAQHLEHLWFATYLDVAGILYETGKDLWAFFTLGEPGYVEVPCTSPNLVVCGHCPAVIEQAQRDAWGREEGK